MVEADKEAAMLCNLCTERERRRQGSKPWPTVQTKNRLKSKPAPLAADPPQPTQSKSKSSRPKGDETKVKEVLKDAQEAFRKAQEAQKKARENMRRVKENAKELSIRNRIKALNEVEAGQSRLGQMSKGSKITTHQGEKTTTWKQDRKVQSYNNKYTDIFDFKSDENMMLDNAMDVGDAEPAEKAGGGSGGGGVQDTGKRTSGEIKNKRQWKVEQGEKGDAPQQLRSVCKGVFCPVTNQVLQVDQCGQEASYNCWSP